MNRYFFLISFLFSAACIAAAAKVIDVSAFGTIVPPALGLFAWLFGFVGMKNVTRPIDFFFFMISVLALFFSFDPTFHQLTLFEVSGIFMILVYLPRTLFHRQLGFLKMVWIEPLSVLLMIAAYVSANIFSSSGWIGWVIPIPPLFYSVFKTFGLVMDFADINKRKGAKYKVEISKEAPDFSLPDQNDQQIKLSGFRGKNCVLLVFVRGDWCPTCHITLRAYERNKEKFQKNNVTVMAIGPDPIGVNYEMVKKLGLTYHLLADENKECAYLYGVQTQENNPLTKYEKGIPLPATFLISPQGNVEFTSRADHPGEIFNPEDIFTVLEKIA